jgi:hypothetical protein
MNAVACLRSSKSCSCGGSIAMFKESEDAIYCNYIVESETLSLRPMQLSKIPKEDGEKSAYLRYLRIFSFLDIIRLNRASGVIT